MGGCHHILRNHCIQQQIPERYIKQTKANHDQSHHRTAAESHSQSGIQRTAGCIGSTRRSVCSRLHAQKAGESGEESSGKESNRHPGVLHSETVCHNGEKDNQPQKYPAHNLVLLAKVRHSTFAHSSGNLNHLRRTLTLFHHLTMEIPGKTKCHNRSGWNQPE